jgi:hypothetical protein
MSKNKIYILACIVVCFSLFNSCSREEDKNNWLVSDYYGSYKNIDYTEELVKEFTTGTYDGNDVPDDIKHLTHGRIEIDFRYDGGGLNSFMPLLYYGSINKNNEDDAVEEPKFHLAIEIGHYNVIPFPVEYLFYTICTYRQPQYCRDNNLPVIAGKNYTLVIDKKPEGILLQLRQNDTILNIFPHAFFPDSTQMFFNDVTSYTELNKGDSLIETLMVGQGFAGIDKGLHEFNGRVSGVKIFKYNFTNVSSEYELEFVRNQHTENQQVSYIARNNKVAAGKEIIITYEFQPYIFESGMFFPDGPLKYGEPIKKANNIISICYLNKNNIGFYKVHLKTIDTEGKTISSTTKPFEIWVYPKEWNFEFY